ncbi:MAG: hypothetical protein IKM08_08920, partial [Clostridia bacterium]|nr:hypothetical protein [Clostridia bacterium]
AFRQRFLMFIPRDMSADETYSLVISDSVTISCDQSGTLLGTYDIVLDDKGALLSFKQLQEGEEPRGTVWCAYLQTAQTSPRFNNQTYVNTLDKKAIDRFIEITYEAYKKRVGKDFGGAIPAMFTDEPQFSRKNTLPFATSKEPVMLPWTDDLADTFKARYGEDLLENLPELLWERADGKPSTVRYHYHDHVCDRFTEAFADNCGAWCRKNGLALTGHMMREPRLESQTGAVGEAMRAYRAFDLPGIDMLADRREYTTAKQAQSAVHQYGCEGMMSELYGVTGWDFDFRRHKTYGDWQAALGVTVRVPHLAWVSMEGEAKRDYPASINYQSPWYKEYSYIEDHFARVATALTRGRPEVRVGVIHPIESYWLHWGPSEQTALIRDQLEYNFLHITDWLLFGTVDFNYICESLLPEQNKVGGAPLTVGKMAYDVIIVPACETLRSTTLERLEAFQRAGGKLIFMGEAPRYVDAVESERPAALYAASTVIPFNRSALLDALEPYRSIEIRNNNGALSDNLLYQLRRDGEDRWLFVAMAKEPYNHDISKKQKIRIEVRGHFRAELYNTMDGSISAVSTTQSGGSTYLNFALYPHDSLLLRLIPHTGDHTVENVKIAEKYLPVALPLRADYTLHEPNALLLDMVECRLDDEDWRPEEEVLRADTAIRRQLGYDVWGGECCQPWCMTEAEICHTVAMRFTFSCDFEVIGANLGAELPETAEILLDGSPVANLPNGFYVDHSIKTYSLPAMRAGRHVLELIMPYGTRSALERCYILGDFGVFQAGRYCTITRLPASLAFGDITRQLLPFYSGRLTYHIPVKVKAGKLKIRLPQYRAACCLARVDNGESKQLSLAPYAAELDTKGGNRTLCVDLYINRTNGFGPVHLCDRKHPYVSPKGWRSSGDSWSYEYWLQEEGLLSSPVVENLPVKKA